MKLTQEDIDFIKNLSHEMKTQDNRGTAQPYGLIIGGKTTQIADFDNCDNKAVHWNESEYYSFEDFIESLEDYYLEDAESHPVIDFIKSHDIDDLDNLRNYEYDINELISEPINVYGYTVEDDFTSHTLGNFFLTDKSAKAYVEANKHNMRKPFTYGIHLYRNPEMERLYQIIHKMADSLS